MHDETSALLGALAVVKAMLAERARELRSTLSDVTYELSVDGPLEWAREDGRQRIAVSGYVDASPEGQRGYAWLFDIAEGEPTGWQVSRTVTLYPLAGDNLELDLPAVTFARWADVAEGLPGLIRELLATDLPS